ncbi:MAG: DUF1848 domain-containing protein [Sedimentisphaerales bacterium]|nr:DUF1848 domain-containing protein [Sedimentisphaerales bacterium]
MKRIISVSRRTDIPAFYSDWFMGRIREGFAGVVHPFGGRKYLVSLRPEDVACFVFWSKDFSPFIEHLEILDTLGYSFYFNYTVTALPAMFESHVNKHAAIDSLKQLSNRYSPQHIQWRYDPILLSNRCDQTFHLRAFEKLASELEGFTERCIISFVTEYKKVTRNYEELERTTDARIANCSQEFKIALANDLAVIAERHGIRMYSCCGDYLTGEKIKKAHCVDGALIETLFSPEGFSYDIKPTRKECGCAQSLDIGAYDTCPHGCVYCYANANKRRADKAFNSHDKQSAFLGYPKSESDRWLAEIQNSQHES